MTAPPQPYDDRESTFDAFACHVNAGKVAMYRQLGLDAVMGDRGGSSFGDAWADKSFINCHCNGGVFNLGHRHPRIVAALRNALDSLDIGNHHLVSGWRARLAERLAATTGGRLPGVVFGVGGGEAIDLAIKVARAGTSRQTIVSVRGGYHGHTGLAMAAGDPEFREPFGPNPPGFVQVPFDDLEALEPVIDDSCAAVLLEPIPATLGMPTAAPSYFEGVQSLCRESGAKLIIDEVQTGLGRTGTMWAYQRDGLEPDVVVTGKGLSGGLYPIAATLMTRELHSFFDTHPHIHVSTFGGAELGCVVALEVLDIIEEPDFLSRVNNLAVRFRDGLRGLPFDLRQRGLMMGFAFAQEGGGMMAAAALYKAGVFAVWANNDPRVLQFLPPLVLSDAEADELIERVRAALR
ncbi:MAG: aminotransferase class III-fold pyridoxal phosphate-dependent enzyme [Thermoanaerobaculales bacterium]|nr:aminotransferase class III-fold pyridoxal phosphate-dependent enzyme [Thermoanaerobaculales bacterium]